MHGNIWQIPRNKWMKWWYRTGKKMSEASRKKLSESCKWRMPWNVGKKHSEETRRKISEKAKLRKASEETRKKISDAWKWRIPWNKWKVWPWIGKHHTEESKEKMRKAHIWKIMSEKTKKLMSEQRKWDKNARWRWWLSYEPYTTDWTTTLRRSIRERDHYTCQICWKPQWDIALDVHHINYIKTDCNPENLVSLCKSCHTKTNNNRNYWIDYFNYLWR